MKRFSALIIATTLLLCSWAAPAMAQAAYKQPYPHSTGAQLLPYCRQVDVPVELLRCDFYVQAVADLATTPVNGKRLACIPRGTNRTELLEFTLGHLSSLKPEVLEKSSAASLILQALQKEFRCPKEKASGKNARNKSAPAGQQAIDPAEREARRKAFQEAVREQQSKAAGKE
jgi:hypothetical protein